ncbi:hypothetical protein AFK68_10020 [Hydrocoleum sp. CS-953]|uniref:DUF4189 domain-containing protein n=1 Tax=Hydrocoleum sp. CS-953 TaxID=1671698 RepID=UPI000B9C55DE|nr:DUF4189 domain-containing protein [Hydrocoleum sp. CS-953]OZH54583.1 hypothetical protein AFK68_10020 [Hydrocoleum sp. CS-953]
MNMLLKPTKLIKYSLMAFIIGTSVVVSHQEKAWAGYGAISYSPETGRNGISNNQASRESAVQEARRNCAQDDCKTRWVRNSCLVLVVDNSKYYFGSGISLGSAEKDANCSGPQCKVTKYLCTNN